MRGDIPWREEIISAIEEWIKAEGGPRGAARWGRLGAAHRSGEPGQFQVDVRDINLSPDQAERLKIAGFDRASVETGFTVLEASQSGSKLTVRVPEFVDPEDPSSGCSSNHQRFSSRRSKTGSPPSTARLSPINWRLVNYPTLFVR